VDVTRFSAAKTTPSGVDMPIAVEPNWNKQKKRLNNNFKFSNLSCCLL